MGNTLRNTFDPTNPICPACGELMEEDTPDEMSGTVFECKCGCVTDFYGTVKEMPRVK